MEKHEGERPDTTAARAWATTPQYPVPGNYPVPGAVMPAWATAAAPGGAPTATMPVPLAPAGASNKTRRTVLLVASGFAALVPCGLAALVLGAVLFGGNITAAEVRDWPEYKQPMYHYAVRLPGEPEWKAPRLSSPVRSHGNCRSCEYRGCSIGLRVIATGQSSYDEEWSLNTAAVVDNVRKGTGGKVIWQGDVKCAGKIAYGYTVQAGDRYFSGRMLVAFPMFSGPVYYILEFNDYRDGEQEAVDAYFASFRLLI